MNFHSLPENTSVLVGDESSPRRTVICNLLGEIGITSIMQAAGRSEISTALGSDPVDTIMLTGCNTQLAIQITAEIRASIDHAYIPLILVIDHVDGQTAQSARDAGVTDFLARPVTADSLSRVLAKVLPSQRPGATLHAKQAAIAELQ